MDIFDVPDHSGSFFESAIANITFKGVIQNWGRSGYKIRGGFQCLVSFFHMLLQVGHGAAKSFTQLTFDVVFRFGRQNRFDFATVGGLDRFHRFFHNDNLRRSLQKGLGGFGGSFELSTCKFF